MLFPRAVFHLITPVYRLLLHHNEGAEYKSFFLCVGAAQYE